MRKHTRRICYTVHAGQFWGSHTSKAIAGVFDEVLWDSARYRYRLSYSVLATIKKKVLVLVVTKSGIGTPNLFQSTQGM